MLQSFYNNLFAVEITILGIVTAAILVSLQVLYTNYSHNQTRSLFKSPLVVFYFLLTPCLLALTALSGLLLSIENHNFFSKVDFQSNYFLTNPYFSLFLLTYFFGVLFIGFFIIQKSIKLLDPHTLISEHRKSLTNANVRNSLFKKYGVPEPSYFTFDKPLLEKLLPELQADDKEVKDRKNEAQALVIKTKKSILKADDYLEGLSVVLIKAIGNVDIKTVRSGTEGIVDIVRSFLRFLKDSEENVVWSPNTQLPNYLSMYVAETLKLQIETCEKVQVTTLASYFIAMSKDVALEFIEQGYFSCIKFILVEWKFLANKAILTGNQALFKEIIASYREIGNTLMEVSEGDQEKGHRELNEVFKSVGWLSERLLTQKELEIRPVMYESDYSSEYDSLVEFILHFSDKYKFKFPQLYPLIYFDLILVFFEKLLVVYRSEAVKETPYKKETLTELEHTFFNCIYAISSFGEDAVSVQNVNGVMLAVLRLKELNEQIVQDPSDKLLEYIVSEMVDLQLVIGASQEKLQEPNMLSKPIIGILEEVFIKSTHRRLIEETVNKKYRDIILDSQGTWNYVKTLGVKMNTNFQLGFNEVTGEDYPPEHSKG
jgi:hypothetical protein